MAQTYLLGQTRELRRLADRFDDLHTGVYDLGCPPGTEALGAISGLILACLGVTHRSAPPDTTTAVAAQAPAVRRRS